MTKNAKDEKSNSFLSQIGNDSYFFSYNAIISTISYVAVIIALSFFLYLFGALGFLTGIGHSLFYSNIIIYCTAGSLSYALNFKFFSRRNFTDIHSKKVAIICILSSIVVSAVLAYNLMSFFKVLELINAMPAIYLPIIVLALNLFVCVAGDSVYHHESVNIPILFSILFPIIGIMPGFFNYNIIIFVSFIIAFGITKLVRQPFLMLFDNELGVMQKSYDNHRSEIENMIENVNNREYILNALIDKKIDTFVANRILDKVAMNLIERNFDDNTIKDYLLRNQTSETINKYFQMLCPNLKKWIKCEKIKNKIRRSHANKFFKSLIKYDFATTRSYYLKPNSSQGSLELSSTIFILLVLSPLNVFLPNLFVSYSFFVTISSLSLGILAVNLGVLYYSQRYLGYEKDSNPTPSNENKILFGINYSHKPGKNQVLSGSTNFNTYFLIIASLFILYIFQNVFFDMYLHREASFIPWVSFWPQILVLGTTILFTLSIFLKSYNFSLENRIVYLALILYSGILINMFCPQLLLLFSATPTLTNYIVMICLTGLATHLFTIIGNDDPMPPGGAYGGSPLSPFRISSESRNSLSELPNIGHDEIDNMPVLELNKRNPGI